MTSDEREIRAFEAIVVSQLRRERDPMNLDDLPELSESLRATMDALPADLVDSLWDTVDADVGCPARVEAVTHIGEEELVGMNRADDEEMDEETRKALDDARREVIESMRKLRKEDDGANS